MLKFLILKFHIYSLMLFMIFDFYCFVEFFPSPKLVQRYNNINVFRRLCLKIFCIYNQ